MTEYISISRILLKSTAQYSRAYLYTEMDDRDLTYIISYNLKTLRLAFQELRIYVSRRQEITRLFFRNTAIAYGSEPAAGYYTQTWFEASWIFLYHPAA